MTGDVFGRELQRLRDVQVAEAVAAERERIAVALESVPWADEGPYARDAAALVRSFASRTVVDDTEMPTRPAVRNGERRSVPGEGAGHTQPQSGQMRATSVPRTRRLPVVVRYDANPTVDSRDPQAYAKYAADLDEWVPGWHLDNLERMTPGLAEQAQARRTEGDPR